MGEQIKILQNQLNEITEEYTFLEQQQTQLIQSMAQTHQQMEQMGEIISVLLRNYRDLAPHKDKMMRQLSRIQGQLKPILFTEISEQSDEINRVRATISKQLEQAQFQLQAIQGAKERIQAAQPDTSPQHSGNVQLLHEINNVLSRHQLGCSQVETNQDIIYLILMLAKHKSENETLLVAGRQLKQAMEEQLQCQSNSQSIINDQANRIQQLEQICESAEQQISRLQLIVQQRGAQVTELQAKLAKAGVV